MTTKTAAWTDTARAGLERYFTVRLAPDQLDGADPADLRDDLETHLEEEFAREGVRLVTMEDLRRALARMGETLPALTDSPAPAPAPPPPTPAPASASSLPPIVPQIFPRPADPTGWLSSPRGFLFVAFVWPFFTFLFEVVTRGGAGMLFDPMPDLWHHLLVLLVPVTGWLFWMAQMDGANPKLRTAIPWLLGAALAVAGFYTICFLPIMPYAAVGIIWLGVGLLPFAAFVSLLALWRAKVVLVRAQGDSVKRPLRWAFRAMVVLIAVLELPGILTNAAIHRAEKSGADSETWASTTRLIRRFGSEQALLRSCYTANTESFASQGAGRDPASWLSAWFGWTGGSSSSRWDGNLTVSRDLYFRVTGRSFNDVPRPAAALPLIHNMFNTARRSSGDEDRGGTRVAGRIDGLSLADGRIDWHCEAASGLTWGEWTMTFNNTTGTAEEARCRIALPPGGFVSRVTLWVNGQPEEAAYSTVAKVRAAYQSVAVVQRRDPVLVTQPDAGSLLVQAFPVPAHGQLKTRITFTVPAGPDGRVWLPSMVERNFELPEGGNQPLWIQADGGTLTFPPQFHPHAAEEAGKPTLTANLPAAALTGNGLSFTWSHQAAPVIFCEDPFAAPEAKLIVREASPDQTIRPQAIAWVIDTSAQSAPWRDQIRTALPALTGTVKTAVFLPGDSAVELQILTTAGNVSPDFAGGRDNIPALAAAVEWLRGQPDGVLIWLHGPQPSSRASRESLEQLLDRSVSPFTFLDLPLLPGENAVSALFSGRPRILAQPLRFDGTDFAASLRTGLQKRGGSFRSLPAGTSPPDGAIITSDALARWFARTEATRLALTDPAAASTMAASHQIVSPWSGAVVLERASDYTQHGLTQSTAAVSQQIPVIPEPSGVLLLLLSASHFLLRRQRSRS